MQYPIPSHTKESIYNRYEVNKYFDVESGEVAPWFGDPGGGIQYVTDVDVDWLLKNGYLEEVN